MTQDTGAREPDGDEPGPAAPDAVDGAVGRAHGGPEGLEGLEGLDDLPLAEHVTRFTAVHDTLRDRLDNPVDTGRDGDLERTDERPVQAPGADD